MARRCQRPVLKGWIPSGFGKTLYANMSRGFGVEVQSREKVHSGW